MKITFIIILLMATDLFASAEITPDRLVGAKITTKFRDGSVWVTSRETHMVVDVESSRKSHAERQALIDNLRRQLAAAIANQRSPIASRASQTRTMKKNRFNILGGIGPAGLEQKDIQGGVLVSTRRSPIFGGMYSRVVFKNVSASLGVLGGIEDVDSILAFGGVGFDW